MNRQLACGLGIFVLWSVPSVWAQGQGGTPSSSPASGTAATSRSTTQPRAPQRGRTYDQLQGPVFVSGRVVMETGRPVSESVSVELNCGMRPLQVIHTDLGGYFTFQLGTGMQSNMDFSASNDSVASFGGSSTNSPRGFAGSMTGCELRVSVPGYHPLSHTLAQHSEMGRVEVGTLRLQRIAGMEGSAISVTSLLVPNDARKEYEKALQEIQKNRAAPARQHLEKAVSLYEKYAAAWNELGRIYLSGEEKGKAGAAFQKAIESDPQYIPPQLNLATLQLQEEQWQEAVDTAGRVLQLDSSIGFANFVQAVGNFNLNHLEAAEKDARAAENTPHTSIPQLHALLAEILLQKQDFPAAAVQMRTYLQESPTGQFAARMKQGLEEVEKMSATSGTEASPPAVLEP